MNITLLTFDTLDSTNTEALKQARQGADEGLCVIARQQTAGRGRHGRVWVSEPNAGLYFSIVLRPKIEAQFLPLVTLMAGVAVHDALAEIGVNADIKWVNDLLVRDKKISGILAETTETNTGLAVVVGIGINLSSSNFPPEIADTATSVEDVQCTSPRVSKGDIFELSVSPLLTRGLVQNHEPVTAEALTAALIRFIGYFYSILQSETGPAEIIEEWHRRSSYFSGKRVRVKIENEAVSGTTDGLEPNGALRLKKDDGSILIIQAGDVERLRSEP